MPRLISSCFGALLMFMVPRGLAAQGVSADMLAPTSSAHVVDIFLGHDGSTYWNTNPVSLLQVATRLDAASNQIDAIALHTRAGATNGKSPPTALLRLLAKKTAPVILVEESVGRPAAIEPGNALRTVNLGLNPEKLEAVAELHNRLTGGHLSVSNLPAIKTSFELSDEDETYHFQKIELGLRGRKTWLMHERISEEESTTGVQLKKSW